METMKLTGISEGNLKNISLEIPKNKLVVLTGISGSGKSTLAVDVLYNECQRQYLEAMGFQGIHKPHLEKAQNLSPAIVISQQAYAKNPRSSVGTVTDIYTDLRMVYEKLGRYTCPHCGAFLYAYECREEVEKKGDEFTVYQYCSHCKEKMHKLTRTYFSYNTKEGACEACQGLGRQIGVRESAMLHSERSLEDGAVDFWEHRYKEYQITCLYHTFEVLGMPAVSGIPVEKWSEDQRKILLYGTENIKTVKDGKFEGIYNTLMRKLEEKGGEIKNSPYYEEVPCEVCHGERLNERSRSVTVEGVRLPELSQMSLERLYAWIMQMKAGVQIADKEDVRDYIVDLETKIKRLLKVGLSYLTLDRQTMTLSGGEAQRIKLAAALDSEILGIIYILDEPTAGLHAKDTEGMLSLLMELKNRGNTVIVIEHDVNVMKAADYIMDIGPGAGKYGGELIGAGTFAEILSRKTSVTGQYLRERRSIVKRMVRKPQGEFVIKNAALYNLKNIEVKFPVGCLTCVTGVSGSGKSTLVFEVLAKQKGNVIGLERFAQIITVEQSPLTRMRRSNVATYVDIYTDIRNLFGKLTEAKEQGFTAKHFSFNTKGGRCEHCEGLGYVVSNMLFFEDREVTCPTCGGRRFHEDVLRIRYKGHSIKDVLDLSIEEAVEVFADEGKIVEKLKLLQDAGLSYLTLGQSLTTLSGGEGQRLKLAKELLGNSAGEKLYLLDEPTVGLHPLDVEQFLKLMQRMVDAGNTVIVVEHNEQVMEASDFIVDLGPEGGEKGGLVVACGTPEEIRNAEASATGRYLKQYRL